MYKIIKKNIWIPFESASTHNNQNKLKFEVIRFLSTQSEVLVKKREVTSTSLGPQFEAKEVEYQWYDWWEAKNFFKPSKPKNESFIILLPPPNITGVLHLGHVLTTTIQDVIIRWKRMKGNSVLWIPGIDHGGIATQVAVEKHLFEALGITKRSLEKQKFLNKIWEWKEEKSIKIIEQLRCLGASLDWTKLRFTMDPEHSQLVTDSFIKLYNEGLIYRNKALVNWSCALKSSISDIEVEKITVNGSEKLKVPGYSQPVKFGVLYNFAYKVVGEDDEIVVSTTRPETILGDVAVAVHPNDPNYARFQNKQVWHPFRKEKIPIIFEDFVDRNFGTGAVKITPAHSLIDYEVGKKNNLKNIQVINEEGCINKIGCLEMLHGLKRFDARYIVVKELEVMKLFRGYQSHKMEVPICSRSGDVVEMILKDQWFLKIQSLAEKAIKYVETEELKLRPESFNKMWYYWLENCRDWNLSRQLIWGHPIPMYECKSGDRAIWVPAKSLQEAREKASLQLKTSSENLTVARDPDVLDTWFSSALLPLGVLSEERCDEKPPISLMITGHDILFFWVARMVMLCSQISGKLPFNNVFLHSLISDEVGRKMSKSKGNVIYPEDIIHGCSLTNLNKRIKQNLKDGWISEKESKMAIKKQIFKFPNGIPCCGVDALRFSLCSYDVQGHILNFNMDTCLSNRHFCNKIWQALKYYIKRVDAFKQCKENQQKLKPKLIKFQQADLNIFELYLLSRLAGVVKIAEQEMENFNFYRVVDAIRLFFVEDFCRFYLETTKPVLNESSMHDYEITLTICHLCFDTSLKLLSPFMPFTTEHLYQALPPLEGFERLESVTIAKYPELTDWENYLNSEIEDRIKSLLNIIRAIRRMSSLFDLKNPNVYISCSSHWALDLFGKFENVFTEMANVKKITRVWKHYSENMIQTYATEDCVIFMEHEFDRKTLIEKFESKLKNEKKLKEHLLNLLNQNEKFMPDEKSSDNERRFEKIKELRKELKKINEIKEIIRNCRE